MAKTFPLAMILAGAVVAMAVGPGARQQARMDRMRAFDGLTTYEVEMRNASPFAAIMGEVRTSAADLMYVKTERYIHGGVAYTPHLSAEEMARTGEVTTGTGDEAGGSVTIIPQARDDFRGPIGALERAVKPYLDPEDGHMPHAGGEEVLPWFRVMTAADPHFIRGYRIGAMWLINNKKWEQARDFLEEGLAANEGHPEQFRLYTSMVMFRIKEWSVRNRRQGEDWVEPALEAGRKSVELALAERPPLGEEGVIQNHLLWSSDLEEDFRFSARYVAILERRLGLTDRALESARRLVELAPDDQPAQNILRELEAELSATQ